MKIIEMTIRHLQMELKSPFTTSFGTFTTKNFLLLEAKDEAGTIGCVNLLPSTPLGITKRRLKRIGIC